MIYFVLAMILSGCAVVQTANTPQTPCHGRDLAPGSCPTSTVLDMDGTDCHHEINCGGNN